ncbi:MAG: hypothetical protein EXR58_01900 [Chloroflexi bacterium]|nr:hypothetical protein [Chloroflexota bacterium]
MDADLVLTGRRRGDNAEVYLVAEVSVGVGISNVRRASERASILARLGRPTLAVVAGERISRDADELARATDVHQVLQRAQPPEV